MNGRVELSCAFLTFEQHFDYSRNVETTTAVNALAALAHESRLAMFRLLVQAGPQGLAAGALSHELHVPPATLSFHLANLSRAGLVHHRQEGRFVIYSADFKSMRTLVDYLTKNCCAGPTCAVSERTPRRQSSRRRLAEAV